MKFLHQLNLIIRSFIYGLYIPLSAFCYCIICLLAWPLPLRYRYSLILAWNKAAIWMLKVVCRIDYTIEGLENIPKDGTGIVLSKHQSSWETFLLPLFFHQTAIILKRELLWVPFFGWGLATIDPIAINRNDHSSAMEQVITKGKKCLEDGRWILIFPEGTRIPYGQVGKYRIGGARLAVATGYPVIPVAHNAGRFWPRRTFIKQPGTIRVIIGPVIPTQGRTAEDVIAQTKNWIEDTIVKIASDS